MRRSHHFPPGSACSPYAETSIQVAFVGFASRGACTPRVDRRLHAQKSAFSGRCLGFGACATRGRTGRFEECRDAFGLTGEQFEQIAFEDIQLAIDVGNEQFFRGALQRDGLQRISTRS